jgi:hypothetical protein
MNNQSQTLFHPAYRASADPTERALVSKVRRSSHCSYCCHHHHGSVSRPGAHIAVETACSRREVTWTDGCATCEATCAPNRFCFASMSFLCVPNVVCVLCVLCVVDLFSFILSHHCCSMRSMRGGLFPVVEGPCFSWHDTHTASA